MKRLQKFLSALLVLIMAATLVTGCNKKETTMFTVMEEAAEVTKYSYEMTFKIESDEDILGDIELTLNGATDGKRTSVGGKIKFQGVTIKFKEFLIIEKDAFYINVEEISSLLSTVLGESAASVVADMKWVKLEFSDEIFIETPKESGTYSFMCERIEEALEEFEIESEDGVHSVTIEGIDDVIDFLEVFYETMEDSEDEYIDKFDYLYDVDYAEILYDTLEQWMYTIVEAGEEYKADNNLSTLNDDELEALFDSVDNSLESAFSEVESSSDVSFDSLLEAVEQLVDALSDYDEDDAQIELTFANSVTGKAGAREFTTEISAEVLDNIADEEIKIFFESVVIEDKDMEVDIPKKVETLEDIAYKICDYAYNYGLFEAEPNSGDDVVIEPDTEPNTEPVVDSNGIEYVQGSHVYLGVTDVIPEYLTINGGSTPYTLTYDADIITINEESDASTGNMYFGLGSAYNSYVTAKVRSGENAYSLQEYFDMVVSLFCDDEYYNVVVTEPYYLMLSNITIVRFDINYSYLNNGYEYDNQFQCYYIDLGNGDIIMGEGIGFYGMDLPLSFNEYLAYLYYNLEEGEAQQSADYNTVDVSVSGDSGRVVTLGYDKYVLLHSISSPDDGMVIFDYSRVGMEAVLFVTVRDDVTIEELYNMVKANNSDGSVSGITECTIGGYVGYRYDVALVADNGETVTNQYWCMALNNGIVINTAFCDEPSINTAGITVEDLVPYFTIEDISEGAATEDTTAINTDSVTMSYKNATTTLTYNSDYVTVDESRTNLTDGIVCFEYADDYKTFCLLLLAEYDSAEDVYEEYGIADAAYYEGFSSTDMYSFESNDVVVYRFDTSYVYTDENGQKQEHIRQYYTVELGNGYVIAGYSTNYDEYMIIDSLDEMLSYIFVDVE